MVFTRSQKRNFDSFSEQNEDDNHNIKKNRVESTPESLEDNDSTNDEQTSYPSKLESIIKNAINETLKKVIKNYKEQEDEENEEESEYEVKEEEEGEEQVKDEYETFAGHIESIYDGGFFERHPLDDKKGKLKTVYDKQEMSNINRELETIKQSYKTNAPSILEILKMNTDIAHKQKLLERVYHFTNSEILSSEYTNNLKFLNKNIRGYDDESLRELEKKILEKSDNADLSDNYREKILKSKMSFENKVIAYKRLEVMEAFESTDTSEYAKYKSWMDILLSIPFDNPIVDKHLDTSDMENTKSYVKNVRNVLDKRLSFLEKPKDQIINIVTQTIRNPEFTINAIGLYGPKGTGKSSIIKSISEALGRPYRTISLGGESDSSLLTGHGFTYVGSCPGRIIEIFRETKCTNPIILFDELDKVSETHQGKEIIGNLIHLTDSTTNNKYNYDKYFSGLEFDLSRVLFVFTYNDASKVDKILADRLFKIKVDNYSVKEKLEIAKKHLIIIKSCLKSHIAAQHLCV